MGWPCQIACLAGEMQINAQEIPHLPSLVILENHHVTIRTKTSSRFVLLAGEPLNEPIAHYGPFVMNTREDLQETFRRYQSGKFGR